MQIKENTIAAAKIYFKKQLSNYYPTREIDSMLRIAFSDLFDLNTSDLLLKENKQLSESELLKVIYLVKDLKKHKPLAYILGQWEFFGLKLMVNEHTLIPRPETEELVKSVLDENKNPAPKILDIGTGTGCIAIALKKYLPQANVIATDISPEAIKTATKNAALNNTDINFYCTNITQGLEDNEFDIIISNPPYISDDEKNNLHRSVIEYEPHTALFPPDEPLYFYKVISSLAQKLLSSRGKLFFEINPVYIKEIKTILQQMNYKSVEARKDINQKWRIVKAEKSA